MQTPHMKPGLTPGETEILIDALSDAVDFRWVMTHLGLDTVGRNDQPCPADVHAALRSLDKLSQAGLLEVGRLEYVDGGPPGRLAPLKHLRDPMNEVADRVRAACLSGPDWPWSCWVVNTPAGDEAARAALSSDPPAPQRRVVVSPCPL